MSHVYVWTMRYESEWRGFVWTIDLLRVCNQTVKQEGFRDFSPSKFVWSYLVIWLYTVTKILFAKMAYISHLIGTVH